MDDLFPTFLADVTATYQLGQQIAERISPGELIALVGDMGAGKTHLSQSIIKSLGYSGNITSPTFSLVQEYPEIKVAHFDLFRVESLQEVLELDIEGFLDRQWLLIIEWADKFPQILPSHTHCIYLEHLPSGRQASYHPLS